MPEPSFHVLIPESIAPEGIALLEEDPRFRVTARKLEGDELLAALADADALIVRSATKVNADLLAQAPRLRAVARAGVGVDNIDLTAATKAGVLVMNTPDGNTVSAAEQTLALMLAAARHTAAADRHVRDGKWARKQFMGAEMRGKTLGVVGLGKIGRRLARYGLALEMKVVASDPVVTREAAARLGIELVSFDDLVARSDVISIHAPLNDHTRDLLDAETLARCKRGVRIVNCARGGIIDEAALAEAVASGHVASAALDVYAEEPPAPDSPLRGTERTTLTPHLGASTVEAQEMVGTDAARQIRGYLTAGAVENAVNAPALDPADLEALAPFAELARRLGSLQAQLLEGELERLRISLGGPVFEGRDKTVLLRACLEGFFRHYQSQPVNFVNVDLFAEEHGIALEEVTSSDRRGYVNLVTVEVVTRGGRRSAAGTIFGERSPRLVFVDSYHMDAILEGEAMLLANDDRPGMLGQIASALGAGGVNIANVSLGRDAPSGTALAFLNLDQEPDEDMLTHLRTMPGILWLRGVSCSG